MPIASTFSGVSSESYSAGASIVPTPFAYFNGTTLSYPGTGTSWFDQMNPTVQFATLTNGPTFSTNNGGVFTFDGLDDFAIIVDPNLVQFGMFDYWADAGNTIPFNYFYADALRSWTIDAWFKFPISPVNARVGNASYAICGSGGGIGGAETLCFFVNSLTDTTYVGAGGAGKLFAGIRGAKTPISPVAVNDNLWHHGCITYNAATNTGRVYFEGIDTGALNIGGAGLQQTIHTIGSQAQGASTQMFEGSIGPMTYYNRSLSAQEVYQNYLYHKRLF